MRLRTHSLLLSVVALAACTDSSPLGPRPRLSGTGVRADAVSNPPDPNGAPPTVSISPPITVEATGTNGAPVTIQVVAFDNAGNALVPVCNGASADASGVVTLAAPGFPGIVPVTCTATDANGLTGVATTQIRVVDTTPPNIAPAASISVQATGPTGAVVSYPLPSAFDVVGGAVPVTCAPPPGSVFPVGVTTVTCIAVDGSGNSAATSFTVTVTPQSSPIDVLVASLDNAINSLSLPPLVKARLLAYVQNIPTAVAGLTAEQKSAAIQRLQYFVTAVRALTPSVIPSDRAAQLIQIANQIIDALRS